MLAYLRLIRIQNILMIILAQFLIRYFLILPAFQTEWTATGEYPEHLSRLHFGLLVLSTVFIAMAGNIINDVFDTDTDAINRPGSNVIGVKVSEQTGRLLYFLFSSLGILIGFYLAWKIGRITMGFVQVFSAVSLWMYSTYYKKRVLSGNLIISLLSALSILIVGLYEPEFYRNFIFILIYGIFAFLISMIREVIKDMEDVEGDERTQCRTLAVRYGIKGSKIAVYILLLLTVAFTVTVMYTFFLNNSIISFWYLASMFCIPLIGLGYWIYTASEKKDFRYASLYTKVLMLCGILTTVPFYYYFLR